MHPIDNMLNELELSKNGDAFIINKEGILQTPSRYHGKVLEHINLSVPVYSSKAEVIEDENPQGEPLIIGYAYIPDTPFILMIVQKKDELMESWYKRRIELIWFLAISITIILFVILSVVTYLVNKLYLADQEHLTALHHMEYSNRLASIGRLAAGVAHEINNPLAIINEKAGLIKDMFTYQKKYSEDKKLIGLVDSIITSVERCSTITKRLLGFARHMDVRIEPVNLEKIIHEVLGFLEKEASYRSIKVSVQVDPDVPEFESDRGKLQQIFLNLINNAFGAMEEGGRLTIKVKREGKDFITALVSDTGCGIPKKDLERIFCPFFSTKTEKGGTGLGLSITCGLVREIGGKMDVHSEVGKGTTFKLTLPLKGNK
jgi:signal transduction histidine kinase